MLLSTLEQTIFPFIERIVAAMALRNMDAVFEHHPCELLLARFLLVTILLGTTYYMRTLQRQWLRRLELDGWIALARKQRDTQVHKVLTMPAPQTKNTSAWLTAAETRNQILAGKLRATDHMVTMAQKCRTYGRASTGINAITEEFYDEAYEAAAVLDNEKEEFIQHNNNKKQQHILSRVSLLWGVPLCVKDFAGVKGSLSTGGLACRLNRRDKEDALIVQALRHAGAIPLVKGNVVQGMGLSESVNRIWGRSRNPYDLNRTPGGSSSGDAALVASGCVPLSLSADGAGSIRIPASFCGLVGFKPSPARMSFKGCMRPKKDDKFGSSLCVPAVIGPMARSVEDCALFMKAVFSPTVYQGDRNIPPLDFNDKVYQDTKKLRIGYYMTDHFMDPVPTGKRAMAEAIEALEKQGHTCVPFEPPTDGYYHNKLFVGITQAEGNMRTFREGLEGEPMIPDYAPIVGAAALPNFIRPIVKLLAPKRIGHLASLSSKYLKRELFVGNKLRTSSTNQFLICFQYNHRKWRIESPRSLEFNRRPDENEATMVGRRQ